MDEGLSKAVIAGGTGLIGSAVAKQLAESGWDVCVLTRSDRPLEHGRAVVWDGKSVGDWTNEIEGTDVLLNFSGYPIVNKWTAKNLAKIDSSRIGTTELLAQVISTCEKPPRVWINASAIGFYGDTGDREATEASKVGEGYMGDLCQRWENACLKSETPETRKICLRTGIVVAEQGEFVKKLTMQTKLGLGSALGTGKQYMSWIHIEDLVRLVDWCITGQHQGPINAVSPNPETNEKVMAIFRKLLHRPPVPNVPAFVLKVVGAIAGIEPSVLLISSRVYPEIAHANGFRFKYTDLQQTLALIMQTKPEAWRQA